MNKHKLFYQIIVCCLLIGTATFGSKIENETFSRIYNGARELVTTQLSLEDVKAAGARMTSMLTSAPVKVVSAVAKANEISRYGEPIDKQSEESLRSVHAVAGGMVIASGRDKERGLYVEIKHEKAVSVYGNLSDIKVVESERVQRGEIIGSYDDTCGSEFFYELQEGL